MKDSGIYDLTLEVHLMKQHMRTNGWIWDHIAIPLVTGSVCLANLVSILSSGPFTSLMVGANLVVLLASFYAMAWMMRSLTVAYRRSRA
jgi:hypothetical protein